MRRFSTSFARLSIAAAIVACASAKTLQQPPPGDFHITGDPESAKGATWTFTGTVDGVEYDMTGILLKPAGRGPFPAVVISHGGQGSAEFYGGAIAPTMRDWGLVCIAPNYTFSAGVPIGRPGDSSEVGASRNNVLRAHMTRELLRRLGYVDMSRVALHGNSMGAFLDAALAGAYPGDFRAASATGGGVRPDDADELMVPSVSQVRAIRTPYQIHHGGADANVPLDLDTRFDSLLTTLGVRHELDVYPGVTHAGMRLDSLMLRRVREWYLNEGVLSDGRR